MIEVTQAAPDGSAGSMPLNSGWTLDTQNDDPGLRYRQAFSIALPTGGLAEDLVVDTATSLLVRPQHLFFNALASDAPERASVQQLASNSLRVTLPLPRLIRSIRFANAVSPQGKTTRLFRTDGDVVAEEPVASYRNPLSASEALPVSGKANTTTPSAKNDSVADKLPNQTSVSVANTGIGGNLPGGELNVVDARIVVKLEGDGFEGLNTGSITEFNLSTSPENLRVGLRLPALSDEPFFLPLTFAIDQQIDAGGALRDQLGNLIQRLRDELVNQAGDAGPAPTLPDPLELDLIVESDAPCYFTISQFAIRYRLVRQSFPGGEPKQILRFPAGQLTRQQLGFELPTSVTLTQATIAVAGDGADAVAGEATATAPGQLSSLLDTTSDSGLRLGIDHCWSSPLTLAEPLLCGGWDLLLSALAPDTRLYLELMPDNNGAPGGELLASAESLLRIPGQRQLLRFEAGNTLLLQPGDYWLRLGSRAGAATWYLQSQANSRVLRSGTDAAAIHDQAAIANWVAADGPAAAAQRYPELTLSGQALSVAQDGDDWIYDLLPALGASTPVGDALLSTSLQFLASGPKPLTVYPPRIEYEF